MKEQRFQVQFDLVSGLVAQATITAQGPTGEQAVPLAAFFDAARRDFQAALSGLRNSLSQSPLTPVVADHVLKANGKRGIGKIVVDDDGSVWCELEPKAVKPSKKADKAQDGDAAVPKAERGPAKERATGIMQVSLDSLRAEAAALGIDTSNMGRAKKVILAAIEEAKAKAGNKLPKKVAAPTPPVPLKKKDPEPEPTEGGDDDVDLDGLEAALEDDDEDDDEDDED